MISQQYIDDQQLVERYLANQLSEAERAEFEDYFLEHPEVVQQLEIAARIKGGLSGLQHAGELPAVLAARPDQPGSTLAASGGSSKHVRSRTLWYVLPMAAALLLGSVLLRWNAVESTPLLAASRTSFTDTRGALLPLVDSYEILRVRGDSYDAVLELPATPGVIEVRVAPELDAKSYRVQLTRAADNELIARLDQLVTASDGSLLMYLSTSALAPGPYRLEIAAASGAAEPPVPFRLNVLRAQ